MYIYIYRYLEQRKNNRRKPGKEKLKERKPKGKGHKQEALLRPSQKAGATEVLSPGWPCTASGVSTRKAQIRMALGPNTNKVTKIIPENQEAKGPSDAHDVKVGKDVTHSGKYEYDFPYQCIRNGRVRQWFLGVMTYPFQSTSKGTENLKTLSSCLLLGFGLWRCLVLCVY